MNTEVRDHLNFLKGALDVLTGSTTADTSDTMNLWVKRAAAASLAYSAGVTGDTVARYKVAANGDTSWGPGGATANDTNLYRSAADNLKTDDTINVGSSVQLSPTGYIHMGEITDPGTAAANFGLIFMKDDGAGKTQLMVRFSTGAAIQLAIQV